MELICSLIMYHSSHDPYECPICHCNPCQCADWERENNGYNNQLDNWYSGVPTTQAQCYTKPIPNED